MCESFIYKFVFRQGVFSKNYCTLRNNVKTYIKKRDKLIWKYLGALRRRRDKSTWQRKKTYTKTVTKLTLHCQETTVQAGRKRDKTTWQHEGTKVHVGKEHEKITPQYQGLTRLRARSPIWASEASLARTRERPAKLSLTRSREAHFACPNRRACSQANGPPVNSLEQKATRGFVL